MRRIRYSVAMSLDGFIADPEGGYDWIIMDPDIDFGALMRQFDTVFVGRKSYDVARASEMGEPAPGLRTYVFSNSLDPEEHPDVTILRDGWDDTVRALRSEPGKDIWLWGGGELFRAFLERGLVDTVEVAVIPVLLGRGIPLLPPTEKTVSLSLREVEQFSTGVLLLRYDVRPDSN